MDAEFALVLDSVVSREKSFSSSFSSSCERGNSSGEPTRFGTLDFVGDFVTVIYLEWKGSFQNLIFFLYGYIGKVDIFVWNQRSGMQIRLNSSRLRIKQVCNEHDEINFSRFITVEEGEYRGAIGGKNGTTRYLGREGERKEKEKESVPDLLNSFVGSRGLIVTSNVAVVR